jgi:hypothetical protein
MECKHKYIVRQAEYSDGGYMVMKICVLCKDVRGSGFIDEEHELNYLEGLLSTPDY